MEPLRILVVCTANVCRSPVAQRLLQRRLGAAGISAKVSSAGTAAGQNRVQRFTRAAAAEVGIGLDEHEPRRLTEKIIAQDGRDLVITMTRDHLYSVVVFEPDAFGRTFTLPELARRVTGSSREPAEQTLLAWLETVGERRKPNDVMPGTSDDDVVDPYGQPKRFHRAMVVELDELLEPVVASLVTALGITPPVPEQIATPALPADQLAARADRQPTVGPERRPAAQLDRQPTVGPERRPAAQPVAEPDRRHDRELELARAIAERRRLHTGTTLRLSRSTSAEPAPPPGPPEPRQLRIVSPSRDQEGASDIPSPSSAAPPPDPEPEPRRPVVNTSQQRKPPPITPPPPLPPPAPST